MFLLFFMFFIYIKKYKVTQVLNIMFANILKSSETAVELSKFLRNFILIEFIHETIMQRCYRMYIKFNVSFNYYYEF